jgi:hypothetical protein
METLATLLRIVFSGFFVWVLLKMVEHFLCD